MRLLFLIFLLSLLTACVGTIGMIPKGSESVHPASVVLHADTAFTVAERANIQLASDTWRMQTSGLADIRVVYDLDFDSVSNIAGHAALGDHALVRMESWMELVKSEDEDIFPSKLLGQATSGGIHNPWHRPVKMILVVDRLVTPEMFTGVTVHEFGHVLGLPHVPSVQAVMYPSYFDGKTSCLRQPDLAAFCQVNSCGSTPVFPCE